MNYLINIWNRISTIGLTDTSNFLVNRRIILCNQLGALTIADTVLLEVLFVGFGIYSLLFIHTFFILVYCFVFLLNKKGYFHAAKQLLLISVCVEILLISLMLGNEAGVYLYYFPVICASSILFDFKEKQRAFSAIAVCFLSILLLFIPIELPLDLRITVPPDFTYLLFLTILITSFLVTILCVYYLKKANYVVEENLNQAFRTQENFNKELQVREEELTANIEHLSRLTRKIDSEKAKLSAIVESPNHLIWSIDTNYRLIYCNSIYRKSFESRFGKHLQPGDNILNYLDESSVKWKNWYDKALTGSKFSVEHTGKTFIWEVFFNPIVEENHIVGTTMFMQNISSRKEAEIQIIKAKDLAEQASLAKAQFLSTMSHEIRTPMNAVIGMSHLLLEENPRPDQEENLKILSFAAQNLLALINDILDFSKIDAGKIEFEEIEFNLKELIQSIIKTQNHKADENGLKIKLSLDKNIPGFLIGDPVRLNQIITNLLSNAIKFTQEGHIILKAALKEVTNDKVTIDFAVEDTGIGIPDDKTEKIFDSFTQASSETTRKFGGTGLGLAITKKLLELQNSHIFVKSKVGEGSIFYFSLSFKISRKKEQIKPRIVDKTEEQILEGAKILLVEDNRVNQLIISKFLLKWGLQIDMADNGLIAVDRIKNAAYDLVLMDLEMPEMDGYEATRTIRSFTGDIYKEIPIIALTASAMIEVQDLVFAAGMNGYVTKPFNPGELYQILSNHISKRLV